MTSFSMSGVHQLDDRQTELIESFDLEVPAAMTREQLTALLDTATSACEANFHPVLSPCALAIFADIRREHGL
jgi:hypothetical protein